MTAQPYRVEQRLHCYEIDCAGARLDVQAHGLATVLGVSGEIDASNADLIAKAIRRFVRLRAPLILDFSRVDYLGSAGLRVLLLVQDECRLARLHCSVIGGVALRRLTRLVTGLGLPLVDSIGEALQLIRASANGTQRR
ncbi:MULTISPECIES: STAS domain-containing protein [unclassified Mycobacterium]|uniref:STAS domain-containing protein n=1 Tax=unclassified Mycobacterium TaxID=2642494 RepID=UPI0007FBEF24|nr:MULTISPECIES: STAS domain-containing protein [unclassified Mycobacterium]OBG68101.1 sulfate transporter [Mycobacterium sp. E188]OBH39103.1 sulfate transporter [Mycobacterium sp. E183]